MSASVTSAGSGFESLRSVRMAERQDEAGAAEEFVESDDRTDDACDNACVQVVPVEEAGY